MKEIHRYYEFNVNPPGTPVFKVGRPIPQEEIKRLMRDPDWAYHRSSGFDQAEKKDVTLRALVHLPSGQMIVLGIDVSDRVFPDIEQMLLDCAQPIR